MTRGGFKSIKDKGGLPVHLRGLGIDPLYFDELDEAGLNDTDIAKALTKRHRQIGEPAINRTSVKNWRKLRREEQGS